MIKDILLLGNEKLYQRSTEYNKTEIEELELVVKDLHDTLMEFRQRYKKGRAIAAPQIGVFKRLIYMNIEKPYILINPIITYLSDEMMEVVDDCMSFPNLLVKVNRYQKCKLTYRNENWELKEMFLEDNLSELLQHEVDHLDGILATMRAIDNKAFIIKK